MGLRFPERRQQRRGKNIFDALNRSSLLSAKTACSAILSNTSVEIISAVARLLSGMSLEVEINSSINPIFFKSASTCKWFTSLYRISLFYFVKRVNNRKHFRKTGGSNRKFYNLRRIQNINFMTKLCPVFGSSHENSQS